MINHFDPDFDFAPPSNAPSSSAPWPTPDAGDGRDWRDALLVVVGVLFVTPLLFILIRAILVAWDASTAGVNEPR